MGEPNIFIKIRDWFWKHKIKKLFCEHSYRFIWWQGRWDWAFACYVCEKCGKCIDIEKDNSGFNS